MEGLSSHHFPRSCCSLRVDLCGVRLRSEILAELVIPPQNLVLGKGSCNEHLICQLLREGPTEPTQFSFNPFTAISFY